MDFPNTESRPNGHSSPDAMRLLHDELQSVIHEQEVALRQRRWTDRWHQCFLHHNNLYSPLPWTSCLVLVLVVILAIIAYACQEEKDAWLMVEALFIAMLLALNCYLLGWDDKLYDVELLNKAKRLMKQLEACTLEDIWNESNYINIHGPLSPCVTVQWTYRSGEVVNIPCGFLVEGDIILMRPGQTVPAHCRQVQVGLRMCRDIENDSCLLEEYHAGDIYNPEACDKDHGHAPTAVEPLHPKTFIMLETPFVNNLKMMLTESQRRPASVLNNERHLLFIVWIERRLLPTFCLLMLLVSVLRMVFLGETVGHWSDMVIVLPIHGILPLTALVLPLMWKILDIYGVAKVEVVFTKSREYKLDSSFESCMESETSLDIVPPAVRWTWRELLPYLRGILTGSSDSLPRTANVVHTLGSVTSLCCVDKKGVLSWPNPTAEKVFFLRNYAGSQDVSKRSSHSAETLDEASEKDTLDGSLENVEKRQRYDSGEYPSECSFEVLDLTQDAKNGYGMQFDDPGWKKFITSLKPLGLNILLNTCNDEIVESYTEFADHVTSASWKRERTVPTVNKRCFCELARQIGFSRNALKIFQTEQTLGMYRHLPPETSKDRIARNKSFIKYKMPMPNMYSVIAKESNTGMLQLMSQGTADLILDACSDYWDGHDLCPLKGTARKKILDFYHRFSMSSYCTAFSYRPITSRIPKELGRLFIEVPENDDDLYPVRSPSPPRSWDVQSLDSRLHGGGSKLYYHGSMDSLMDTSNACVQDAESCFQAQCNQIFIGMITMQYQAKQDIVRLIEDLESACIRFVHFSKENELRSRVFSEKMGLEAGWNCHISLLSERTVESTGGLPAANPDVKPNETPSRPSQYSRHSNESLHRVSRENLALKQKKSEGSVRSRRLSAPPAFSLDMTQVKFESANPVEAFISPVHSPMKSPTGEGNEDNDDNAFANDTNISTDMCNALLSADEIEVSVDQTLGTSKHSTPVSRGGRGSREKRLDTDLSSELGEPLLSSYKASHDSRVTIEDELHNDHSANPSTHPAEMEEEEEYGENLSSSESYPASSHITENTDSVTGALGLSNRAKLPKGIENIRPHIDNVDNVPLLVSLFTDCTPETTQQMLKILQEYGEVVCCLGSSANIHNTGIFLQANCSLAVEPFYPQVCICQPVVYHMWEEFKDRPGPMELSASLHSLPCSLTFRRGDTISIKQLICQARQHCQNVRNVFLVLLMCSLTVTLVQLIGSIFLLPPALATHHLLWLTIIAMPLLSASMMGSPLDTDIMKLAMSKNQNHISKQAILEFVGFYVIRFLPSIFVCLICHALTLTSFCIKVAVPSNSSCHILYGKLDHDSPNTWSGWGTDFSAGLVFSQNLVACQLFIYFGCASMCFIHRFHHLWHRSPFANRLWCLTFPSLLICQILYLVADVVVHNNAGPVQFYPSDVPLATWVLALLWPIVLIPIHELIKHREIRLFVRYQKRARLDFGTKLGMNSPF